MNEMTHVPPNAGTPMKALIENALNAACLQVQTDLGINSGDLAGVHFSGCDHPMRAYLRTYIMEELAAKQAEAEASAEPGVLADSDSNAEAGKYFRSLVTFEVLSEGTPFTGDVDQLAYAITHGECSGRMLTMQMDRLTAAQMAEALVEQGSDPTFLVLEEDLDAIGAGEPLKDLAAETQQPKS